ncbi:MAG: C40 family peptidase [Clostridioides sp.]|jgi:cell wall-associated NlpC family hydrolase|nr:C40 family peptidase [Clostridioides sp.]
MNIRIKKNLKKLVAVVLIAGTIVGEGAAVVSEAATINPKGSANVSESAKQLQNSLKSYKEKQSQQGATQEKINKLVSLANAQKGKPYKWGATGPSSFDCSGLTSYVYKNAIGVTIPRVSRDQATAGVKVDKSSMKVGDLVFFGSGGSISHVGMYVGDSKFIHAPQTGDVVKVTSMASGTNYNNRFITARRIVQ